MKYNVAPQLISAKVTKGQIHVAVREVSRTQARRPVLFGVADGGDVGPAAPTRAIIVTGAKCALSTTGADRRRSVKTPEWADGGLLPL